MLLLCRFLLRSSISLSFKKCYAGRTKRYEWLCFTCIGWFISSSNNMIGSSVYVCHVAHCCSCNTPFPTLMCILFLFYCCWGLMCECDSWSVRKISSPLFSLLLCVCVCVAARWQLFILLPPYLFFIYPPTRLHIGLHPRSPPVSMAQQHTLLTQ